MRVLYITFDGLLQPLGYSQVLRYVERLQERGLKYTILSFERKKDLADVEAKRRLETKLADAGIEWVALTYQRGMHRIGPLQNQIAAVHTARRIIRNGDVALVHARSYLGAAVAYVLKGLTGVPYLFDIRGYWIDERIDVGRWFGNAAVEKIARRIENALYAASSGVVTLTELSKSDIKSGRFGTWDEKKPISVIPTCADYDAFRLDQPLENLPGELAALKSQDKLIVGFVGSINAAYHVEESIALFRYLRGLREDAHLLCLTRQKNQMADLLSENGINEEDTTIISVLHEEMPQIMSLIDWGFLLLKQNFTRRASMPTKLAEFFAAGVRPIHFGCNSEVADWVARTGAGLTLHGVKRTDLQMAAGEIARSKVETQILATARDISQTHFGLQSGILRYEEISRRLLEGPAPAAPVKDTSEPNKAA